MNSNLIEYIMIARIGVFIVTKIILVNITNNIRQLFGCPKVTFNFSYMESTPEEMSDGMEFFAMTVRII